MKPIIPGLVLVVIMTALIESGFVQNRISVRNISVNSNYTRLNALHSRSADQDTTKNSLGGSPHQSRDKGIGPIKNVTLDPINADMVKEGKNLFNSRCLLCHSLDQVKLGPPLRNITKERAPEFIMNMLLNTTLMEQDDPAVKDLKKTYNKISMTNPRFSQQQARAVLEYLRSIAK